MYPRVLLRPASVTAKGSLVEFAFEPHQSVDNFSDGLPEGSAPVFDTASAAGAGWLLELDDAGMVAIDADRARTSST
jgi:hypothetical protein